MPDSTIIKVKGIPPRPVSFCKECGAPYHPRRDEQDYCSDKCRNRFHKRRQKRGAELYDFAMEWRGKRLKGGFTKLCQLIDGWLKEERDRRANNKEMADRYRRQQKEAKGIHS